MAIIMAHMYEWVSMCYGYEYDGEEGSIA
jgi:hypothetical protein